MTRPGMPDQHDPAPGPDHGERLGERLGAAHAVDDHVGAAGQSARRAPSEPRSAPHGPGQLVGVDHHVGAELLGQLALVGVLGPHDQRAPAPRPTRWRRAAARCRPRVPAPRTATVSPASTPADERGVHGAGRRLDHDRVLVGERVGHGVELGARGRRGRRWTSRRRCRRSSRSAARGRGGRRPRCSHSAGVALGARRAGRVDAAGAQPSTGSTTTRVPGQRTAGVVGPPSSSTPTTSWPGTKGKLTMSSK